MVTLDTIENGITYRRVSSKEQEKGYSLEAQDIFLKEYALKHNIKIIADFCEAESAKRSGRKQFNEMIKYLKEHPKTALLVEKTDRIYRNLKDYVVIDDLMNNGLELHLAKENVVMSEHSNSHEKLFHALKVVLAKNYIDNLREESSKGQIQKAKDNIYPTKAPLGYINEPDEITKKPIIKIDFERAKYVQKAFELYASGDFSALAINNILYNEGLRTPKGRKYAKSTIERMFKNIFYIGKFEYRGIVCEHAQHPPLIDERLFYKVQARINNASDKARSHNVDFAYSNIIKCGVCGGVLTGELKKGKYIYYHCNDYYQKGCKRDSYINETKIDEAIIEILKRLNFDNDFVKSVLNCVKDIHARKNEYNATSEQNIQKQIEKLNKRIETVYNDKIDGNITEDFWRTQNKIYHNEKNALIDKLKYLNNGDEKFYNNAEILLNWCKNSYETFKNGSNADKRFITKILVSNISYSAKKLDIELKPVFYGMLKNSKNNATIEPTQTRINTKKQPLNEAVLLNGGTDEARTRDLLRDRQTL